MNTESSLVADQSAYIPPSEDQVKILKAKALMRMVVSLVPEPDMATDAGYRTYCLLQNIKAFITDA